MGFQIFGNQHVGGDTPPPFVGWNKPAHPAFTYQVAEQTENQPC